VTSRPVAVFDIDGVLADASHREHFVAARPRDWDSFFGAVSQDAVLESGREQFLAARRRYDVVLVSGRPERTRADTQSWLERAGMDGPPLLLRPDADRRPAAVLKVEMVEALGPPEDVAMVVDDDERVVAALRARGYRANFP
jgi:FMN phosphatase YigB (HAD superfamily)